MTHTLLTTDEPLADDVIHHLEPLQQASSVLLDALRGPDLLGKLQALAQRLDNGLASQQDIALLARLPACHLAPEEIVRSFVRVEQAMAQRFQA